MAPFPRNPMTELLDSMSPDSTNWVPDGTVRVLVVDDERAQADGVAEALERVGCECVVAYSGEEALDVLAEGAVDVVVTDMRMGRVSGLDVIEAAKRELADPQIVLLTAFGTFETAVEAMSRGADTCVRKPFRLGEIRDAVLRVAERQATRRENVELRRQLDERYGLSSIKGESPAMQRVFDILRNIAPTDATVLIQGESGVGKELAARAIHQGSARSKRRFVALNCAALSEGILESELFGHEKGAFTGAAARRQGRIEYADGGTLFLDEIGDMPTSTQIKLLRVIEEREITRVGSNRPIKVNVRLLAATNQDLEDLVERKAFREDLYFRINVVRLNMPPLRERHGDIPVLIKAFIKAFADKYGKRIEGITPEARRILEQYNWPGNVRELKNCIESMVVVGGEGKLDVRDIPQSIHAADPKPAESVGALVGRSLEAVERDLIHKTLDITEGNREETARILGIGARTLYRKLDKYGLR